MTGPHPVLAARCLIGLTVLVLPADARDRYREEFRTELCELGGFRQIPESASLLGGSVALRRALAERDVAFAVPKKALRCRIGRHRWVGRRDDNPELHGQPYQVCVRCGARFEPPEDDHFDVDTYRRRSSFFAS